METSGTLFLYSAHTCLKLKGPVLEMHLIWCRTGICSWNLSVEGFFDLDDPLWVSFFCNLKYISLCFIQNSIQVTSKWLIPLSTRHIILKWSPVFLGRSLNSNITYKFLSGLPVFRDYLLLTTMCLMTMTIH